LGTAVVRIFVAHLLSLQLFVTSLCQPKFLGWKLTEAYSSWEWER